MNHGKELKAFCENIGVEILYLIQKHIGILPADMFDETLPKHLNYVDILIRN